MSDRGVYRGIYSALPDDPDFQHLSPNARLALLVVRLCKSAGPASIFRYYPELVMAQTGLTRKALDGALEELEQGEWIEREGPVLWIRNGLRYDPYMRLADQKHRKSVERAIAELPKLEIVLKFCEYYQIVRPFEGSSKTLLEKNELPLRGRGREGVRIPSTKTTNPSPLALPEEGEADWSTADWPSPEALVHLYNTATPDNVPAVRSLSAQRRAKANKMLRQYPNRAWWEEAFKRYHRSRFLSGRSTPANGHEGFQPDFDWLLSNGKNGTENAVKVHDGNYQ